MIRSNVLIFTISKTKMHAPVGSRHVSSRGSARVLAVLPRFFFFQKKSTQVTEGGRGVGCLWQSLIDSRDGSASVADDTSDRQRNEAGDGLHKTESVHL